MDFKAMLEFVSDYGATLVITAVFLYTCIRLINIFIKYLENKVKNKKHDKLLDLRKSVNEKVQSLIETFLQDHDGDRVHVVEFSNSVVSVAYLPFKYMNCTYEVYNIGKTSISSTMDRLSTSLFTPFFLQLYQNSYVILEEDAPDHAFGGAIYDLMHSGKEKQALCAVITTSKGKALGFVAFTKDTPFEQETIDDILVLADKLAALLGIAEA